MKQGRTSKKPIFLFILIIIVCWFFFKPTYYKLNKVETESFLNEMTNNIKYTSKGFFYEYNFNKNEFKIKEGLKYWDIKIYKLNNKSFNSLSLISKNYSVKKYEKINFTIGSCRESSLVLKKGDEIIYNECYNVLKEESIELNEIKLFN